MNQQISLAGRQGNWGSEKRIILSMEHIMAIIEFQLRKQAFLDFFKAEINRLRLPFPKLEIFLLPELKGHLLEQIE